MRRLGVFLLGISLSLGFVSGVSVNSVDSVDFVSANAACKEVYVGGMPAGFTLSAGGAQVIGFCDVLGENSKESPALKAGLRAGDLIVNINGLKIETIAELNEVLDKNGEKSLNCKVMRGEEEIIFSVMPLKDAVSGRYKIGVLIRDGISGIGTVTYIDKENGSFGALGHAVIGPEDKCLSIGNGDMYSCNIVGVSKGVRGKAGELRGMFLAEKHLGKAEKLTTCGIYGKISGNVDITRLKPAKATSEGVKPGKASIYSTISGELPKEYTIEIVKVDKTQKDNKNYVIKITDEALIEETGGIVQGMSGSPILQNGALVGAVTHVFINDPTRGYGISIDQMMIE